MQNKSNFKNNAYLSARPRLAVAKQTTRAAAKPEEETSNKTRTLKRAKIHRLDAYRFKRPVEVWDDLYHIPLKTVYPANLPDDDIEAAFYLMSLHL